MPRKYLQIALDARGTESCARPWRQRASEMVSAQERYRTLGLATSTVQ